VLKIGDLTSVVFAGLSALVIETVEDEDDLIRVMARTRDEPAPCPVCGALTGRVHGYASRTVTDVPVDGRRVVVSLQVRRLLCPAWRPPPKSVPSPKAGRSLHVRGMF
jgi:transposase